MTLLAYFVVTLAIGFSVGWFLACAFVTTGLRKDIAKLDAERLEIDIAREQLRTDRTRYVEAAEAFVRLNELRFPSGARAKELRS